MPEPEEISVEKDGSTFDQEIDTKVALQQHLLVQYAPIVPMASRSDGDGGGTPAKTPEQLENEFAPTITVESSQDSEFGADRDVY